MNEPATLRYSTTGRSINHSLFQLVRGLPVGRRPHFPLREAGPLSFDQMSVGLTAEESRDIELVVLSRIM
ncbi:MAG: hypothetical protein WA214_17040, partial [Pseudolabrys sp.]